MHRTSACRPMASASGHHAVTSAAVGAMHRRALLSAAGAALLLPAVPGTLCHALPACHIAIKTMPLALCSPYQNQSQLLLAR